MLTGDTATTGGTVTALLSDVTGIPITGLADGASNMTFNWNVLNGTTSGAHPGGGSEQHHVGQSGWQQQRFAQQFRHRLRRHHHRLVHNGKTQALGQIALASFSNNNGLQLNGNTDFTPTLASGQAVVGVPGSGELGTLSGGSLELSNVDIATEFANLIVAQRGFEADAKAVTTFDQITQDTIALKQ